MATIKKTKRESRKSPLNTVKSQLKLLSFDELTETIMWAIDYRKEMVSDEEQRLLQQKQELEKRLKDLKTMDKKEKKYN